MKARYYFMVLVAFLFYRCGCIDHSTGSLNEPPVPETEKYFTIINRTNNKYKNNFLKGVCVLKSKSDGKTKLYFESKKIKFQKEGVTEKDILRIDSSFGCAGAGSLFLLSLNGGERKIFFGAHHYTVTTKYNLNDETCKAEFVKWDIHPVWQEKKLTIHIHNDKITFSDPKIKEVKKICLKNLYDDNFKIIGCEEEVDLNTLPLVDCNKVVCGE